MQLILPIIAIGIAAVVSIISHPQEEGKEKTLSVETEVNIPTHTPTSTPTPTFIPASTPLPTNTPVKVIPTEDFVYPNSNHTDGESYESSDDPDAITNWYKEKIKSMGLSVKSFITTKTNGNVLNKLSGADSNIHIIVEIEKKENENVSKIKISKESS